MEKCETGVRNMHLQPSCMHRLNELEEAKNFHVVPEITISSSKEKTGCYLQRFSLIQLFLAAQL